MTSPETHPIQALIVDDESLGRDLISHMLSKHPEVEILAECANGADALEVIETRQPNLVFLDIKMPGMSGIELSERLASDRNPIIVFITAYNEFAIDAFEQNAIDYLLKPFDQTRFDQMMQRVKERLQQKDEAAFAKQLRSFLSQSEGFASANKEPKTADRFAIKENDRVFFLKPTEVDYFQASGNYVELHVDQKEHLVYDTLTHMEEKLDATQFLRIHRSTIVNIERIKELRPHFNGEYVVILKNDARLKLSRSYRDKAKQVLGLD